MVSHCGSPHGGRAAKNREYSTGHLRRLASYYDRTVELYLSALGTTCQAGLIPWFDDDLHRSTSIFVAKRAQIKPSDRILDAGSGFCGPSIEICRQVDGVMIDAVTISARQARVARDLVATAGLSRRISVHVGDYHHLPMQDSIFDIVLYLESSGHSRDLKKLYSEAHRVLRDGGRLYVKDLFRADKEPTPAQRKKLREFDRLYVYATEPVTTHEQAIRKAGFQQIQVSMISSLVTMERMNDAMWDQTGVRRRLSDFGRLHYRDFKDLPIVFSEICARKSAL